MGGSRFVRRIWLTLGVLTLLAVSYYVGDVFAARRHTREVLWPQLASTSYPLAVSDLSPMQLLILLKVEDPAFYRHHGVDLSTPGAGLTTITQALVKVLYFEKFQPGVAKVRQTLIAYYALDPLVGKEDQLRLFINLIGLGEGARGFAEGARHYFGKELRELTDDEFTALVAMIIAPQNFNLRQHPERNQERVARIKRLVAGEYQPKGLCDQYYGPLDAETQKGLAPFSYFASYYQ